MMLRWTRDIIKQTEALLDATPEADIAMKALFLELTHARWAKALFQRHRADAWPVCLSGIAMQMYVEYDADGVAFALAGNLPSHIKNRIYLGSVEVDKSSLPHVTSVECVTTETAREFIRQMVSDCYPVPRF